MSFYILMIFYSIGIIALLVLYFSPQVFLWIDSKLDVSMFNEDVTQLPDAYSIYKRFTFEGDIIKGCIDVCVFCIIAFILPYMIGLGFNEIVLAVGFMFISSMIYSSILLYLRKDIFDFKHDSYSQRDSSKNKKYQINTPYFLSTLFGFYPVGMGLIQTYIHGFPVPVLFWGLLIQIIPYFPDLFDKIVPFDLKSFDNYIGINYLIILISVVLMFIISINISITFQTF
ncbi:hypothetical protein [Methanosphaera sp. WGK6]|uniref:hypothetical protein n=1 Tax=Methanosphaera sp. WGK6 TaxID=1561964 RepID=UPI00084CA4B5|nr:hypothetical protein [Methanosphaera sp. WGK6]OED30380.1 hypothetical protein NL43_03130 [Methanosphaera sp. WGK6]